MNAPNHWRTAAGCWLAGSATAVALGVAPAVALALLPFAASASLGPDIDKPPEVSVGGRPCRTWVPKVKVHPGSTAAEAHGIVSNALAEIVAATHGGHRGLTHRYPYAVMLGVLVACLGWVWPVGVALLLGAWWGAWPLYCSMPRRARWSAWLVAPALTALALVVGALPATPWLGLAVGFGWAAHIACDRLQSGLFENGGRVEHTVAYLALVSGAACFALAATGHWPALPTT